MHGSRADTIHSFIQHLFSVFIQVGGRDIEEGERGVRQPWLATGVFAGGTPSQGGWSGLASDLEALNDEVGAAQHDISSGCQVHGLEILQFGHALGCALR